MVLNRQREVEINLPAVRRFVRRLRARLPFEARDFNVGFVTEREMVRLNAAHRARPQPTDVLSFGWAEEQAPAPRGPGAEFSGFLGDIVISARAAERNARAEGHSTATEVRWLILHGVLHLLGYDHEADRGEMTRLELSLREELGIAGRKKKPKIRRHKIKNE
jgi:rRNA maturation RNase YbeY